MERNKNHLRSNLSVDFLNFLGFLKNIEEKNKT